jgi:hypothetical protein
VSGAPEKYAPVVPAVFQSFIARGSESGRDMLQLLASASVTSPILVHVSPPHSILNTQPRTSSFRGPAIATLLE